MYSYDQNFEIEEDVTVDYAVSHDLAEHQKPSRLRNRRTKQNKQTNVKASKHARGDKRRNEVYDDAWN